MGYFASIFYNKLPSVHKPLLGAGDLTVKYGILLKNSTYKGMRKRKSRVGWRNFNSPRF